MSELFSIEKPIIAMIHLAPLPGAVTGSASLEDVTTRAVHEARILSKVGFDALLLQNTGDVPAAHDGDEATIAYMTRIAEMVKRNVDVPLGINVLMNGSRAALAIASAVGAEFVRIKILAGASITSTGLVSADPHDVLAFRKRIGAEDIMILADVYDRTSAPLGEMPLEVMADLVVRHGHASGLVISGFSFDDLIDRLQCLRTHHPDFKLIVGGGANKSNISRLLELSDGIIVGSAYKKDGRFLDPVDEDKAKAFIDAVHKHRSMHS